jgi:magnesium transporter
MPPPSNAIARPPVSGMSQESLKFVYLSELLGRRVHGYPGGTYIGRLVDLAASPEKVYPRVTGLLLKKPSRPVPLYVPWSGVHWPGAGGTITVEDSAAAESDTARPAESDILLQRSFLDRQLISTSGHKVVRVNDLHLLVELTTKEYPNLWLVHIDIGIKGLLRRLGWGALINAAVRWVLDRDMKDVFVPWKHVQAATTTNVYGSLQLTTDASKLTEMHPADLADILEDLGADERNSLFESLDPAIAAATLAEMPLTLRVRVAESINQDALTRIVHEMETDQVVDLLDNLSAEHRAALMSMFPAETVAEIKELSQLSPASVGSIMNTNFVAAEPATTAREALELLRARAEDTGLIYYLYVVDKDDRLRGVVTLRHILSADPEVLLADLMQEHPISVTVETTIKRAARIFFKYDFDAVPVIDEEGRMRGIVALRDTLESVFPEVREESKG